jgi:hypothetical protein
MRTRPLAAAAILILAALAINGCGAMTEPASQAHPAGPDSRRDYRGDFSGFRYPGPPLTGGGS